MFLLGDSFDFYSSVSDISQRWQVNNFSSLLPATNTAFESGQAVAAYNTGVIGTASFTTGSNESTVYGSIRLKSRTVSGSTSGYSGFRMALEFLDGTNAQCSLVFQGDGTVYVKSGGIDGTNLGTYSGVFAYDTWDSYQFCVVFSTTAGSVQLRKDGSTTPVCTLTNVNTQAGSGNSYANAISLAAEGGSPFQLDDLFLSSGSGAAPNGWLGDLRARQSWKHHRPAPDAARAVPSWSSWKPASL